MKVKICGLKSLEDISYVNEAMPDYAGFIFAEGSKRKVTLEQAKFMKEALNTNIKSVGVFVDEELQNIINTVENGVIDLIQLHGSENNDFIKELKNITGLEVIKAFKADENLKMNIENTDADYVLVDSFNKNAFGGTGAVFNWGLIPKTDKKIFLAGGLNLQNISNLLQELNYTASTKTMDLDFQFSEHKNLENSEKFENVSNENSAVFKIPPYCLDVNSGVETNGKKDRQKILEITQLIKTQKQKKTDTKSINSKRI